MINVRSKKNAGFQLLFLLFLATGSAQVQNEDIKRNLSLAISYQNINIDTSLFFADSALLLAWTANTPDLQIDALKILIKSQTKKGAYTAAGKNWLLADSIATLNGLEDRRIEILMYEGLLYQNVGLNSEVMKCYLSASKLINQSGNKKYEAELDHYFAIAYYSINEYEKCRMYARKSIIGEFSKKDSLNTFESLSLISSSFQNADSIHKYLHLADNISKQNRNVYQRAVLLNNKALFYKATGEIKAAKTSYLEAISISSNNGYKKYLAIIQNNYAYLLMAEKKYDSAQLVLDKALSIARQLENIDLEATVLDSYSDYYAKTGDPAQSLVHYRQSVKLRNKYKTEQQIEKSLFLSTVFETEKKEKEIARQNSQLYRTNAILFGVLALLSIAMAVMIYFRQKSAAGKARIKSMAQEKQLEVANAMIGGQDAERKRLAMNLHDGISPKIASLKLLVDNKFEEADVYHELISSINDIDSNIREISHRMLPSQLESKGLVVALGNFVRLIKQSDNIDIHFYTNLQQRLAGKYEMNIFFVFYELINNVLKHSDATKINLQLLDGANEISISVEDNGKGFDPAKAHDGIGLVNIRQRVSYLNGTMDIDSVPGQGTAVLIEIKKQQ